MDTKTYLKQVERLDRMIQNKLSEIYQLKTMATSITQFPKDVNVQTTPNQDKLGSVVARIVDLERETDSLVDQYIDKRRHIIKQIDSMEDISMYHILSERYVGRKDLTTISVEMGYSFRHVKRIHGIALVEFEKKYGSEYLNS